MLKSIVPALSVLRKGAALANPESWKNAQVIGSFLAALVVLAESFGVPIPFADDLVSRAAIIIATLANAFFTVATTEKIGFPSDEGNGHGDK
jgi:hypothetical protein